MLGSTAISVPDVNALEAGRPAMLPVPEAAAASLLALILLAIGAVISVLLRRRPTSR